MKIMTEADCMTEKLTPQIFSQIRKLGGIKSYASHVVETMSKSVRSEKIEDLVSSFYGSDEEYRAQYGLTATGFDSLNESSYLSHRYHLIRASNVTQSEDFEDMYKTFVREQGDFDLYAYYLLPNSSIKYPKFGVNQYQCADETNSETKRKENQYCCADEENLTTGTNRRRCVKKNNRRVRFLSPQANEKREGVCKI